MILNKTMFLAYSFLLMLETACTQKDCDIWVASPWQQVLRSTPPGELVDVNIKSAANEYESFRIIIHNGSDSQLEDINVTINNLKSENNDVISSDNIKLFRAHYLHITKPSYRIENPVGWYPDALIPFVSQKPDKELENIEYVAAPFSIDTGHNAEVWCDLFVPQGTKSGMYKGTITLRAGKKKLARVPVNLTVWDFELPKKIAMRSNFGKLSEAAGRLMGAEKGSERFMELEELYNQELLKHRAVPGTPDNIWPEWNETEGIVDRGESIRLIKLVEEGKVNALDIPFLKYNGKVSSLIFKNDPKKYRAYLAATAEWLRKLGYLDMAYVYLEDEARTAHTYEIVRKQAALISSADTEVRRMCTVPPKTHNPDWGTLYGAVDIWCPHWDSWDEPTARERLGKGEEVWSYTALNQGPGGTPWWQIDTDPLNFRSPFWLSWHYNITGFLYWTSTYWRGCETLQEVWEAPYYRGAYQAWEVSGAYPNYMFWGEGMLLYPGQPAGINGFVSSIRLKLYREAMEDYEYMVMAANLGNKEEVNKIVNGVVTSFQAWSRVKDDYMNARERLAGLILKNK